MFWVSKVRSVWTLIQWFEQLLVKVKALHQSYHWNIKVKVSKARWVWTPGAWFENTALSVEAVVGLDTEPFFSDLRPECRNTGHFRHSSLWKLRASSLQVIKYLGFDTPSFESYGFRHSKLLNLWVSTLQALKVMGFDTPSYSIFGFRHSKHWKLWVSTLQVIKSLGFDTPSIESYGFRHSKLLNLWVSTLRTLSFDTAHFERGGFQHKKAFGLCAHRPVQHKHNTYWWPKTQMATFFLFFIPYLYVSYTNDTIYIYIYNKKTTGQSTESIHKQNAEGFDFPGFQVFEFQLLSLQFWNLEQTVPLIIEKVESWRFPGFRFQLLCVSSILVSATMLSAVWFKCQGRRCHAGET